MFEKAVRMKLRWHWEGRISVEDLWDLHVEALDGIYKALNRQVKAQAEDSLLDNGEENEVLDLQVAIVKHIVATKLQEAEEHAAGVEKAAKKQKLLAVLARKQDAVLEEMDEEALQALIDDL